MMRLRKRQMHFAQANKLAQIKERTDFNRVQQKFIEPE